MISAAEFKRLQAEHEALQQVARAAQVLSDYVATDWFYSKNYECRECGFGPYSEHLIAIRHALAALPPPADSERVR